MKRGKKKNYLDYVPTRNPAFSWELDERERVAVRVKHRGFYPRLAQRFFHTPPESKIELDAYGSLIWQQIDGSRTIGDIARLFQERLPDQADTAYARVAEFFRILHQNKFVTLR